MNLRKTFIETLQKMAEKDPRIILIVGDVGFSYIDEFKEKFPNQFLNCGIMEQTMLGVAAGLAQAGWKPYVYTMTNFILIRPLEQLRNDVCFANANVKLLGVKGGPAYKFLGKSHNMSDGETMGILNHLDNIHTFFPTTEEETATLIENEYLRVGPAYIQL